MCSELEFPKVDRLDAENAQFRPEHRIPHAKLYILTAGKVNIVRTECFLLEHYCLNLQFWEVGRLIQAFQDRLTHNTSILNIFFSSSFTGLHHILGIKRRMSQLDGFFMRLNWL